MKAIEQYEFDNPWLKDGETPQKWFDARKTSFYQEIEEISKLAKPAKEAQAWRLNCVYFLFNESQLVYVGRSNNLAYRLESHAYSKEFDLVSVILCPTLFVDILELHYIRKFKPEYNIKGLA